MLASRPLFTLPRFSLKVLLSLTDQQIQRTHNPCLLVDSLQEGSLSPGEWRFFRLSFRMKSVAIYFKRWWRRCHVLTYYATLSGCDDWNQNPEATSSFRRRDIFKNLNSGIRRPRIVAVYDLDSIHWLADVIDFKWQEGRFGEMLAAPLKVFC